MRLLPLLKHWDLQHAKMSYMKKVLSKLQSLLKMMGRQRMLLANYRMEDGLVSVEGTKTLNMI